MEKLVKFNDSRDDNYKEFLQSIQRQFDAATAMNKQLFRTNTGKLFDVFLDNLLEGEGIRQHYTCEACRHFVKRFGGLVTISDDGITSSVVWAGEVPEFFTKSVKAMKDIVEKSPITDVFLKEDRILGTPITGEWQHMSLVMPEEMCYHSELNTAYQEQCEKTQDFRMLNNVLVKYPINAVNQALTLLKSETLDRSEKFLGIAEWLRKLHLDLAGVKNSNTRKNIIWKKVATAPKGWCHVNGSMMGNLLDDIIDGLPLDVVKRKFADKVDGLNYQRPKAAPSVGNIEQAEKIIKTLGLEKSLDRRFARLEELQTIWKPTEKKEVVEEGIFARLKPKSVDSTKQYIATATMTLRKFVETVLPDAESIEFFVSNSYNNYTGILTQAHEEAKPILQWDSEEQRNPFSTYVYHNGSPAYKWGLEPAEYCKVTGICYQPSMWYDENKFAHHGKGIIFILDGAKDSGYQNNGNALFPEIVRLDLRGIRSTIEAHSNSSIIKGYEEASACGVGVNNVIDHWDGQFRVTTSIGTTIYKIDRWE